MPVQSNNVLQVILSILFFPLYFQDAFVRFSWGAQDPLWILLLKRLFLLLPVLALIGACWVSMAALLTIIVRHKRQRFFVSLVLSWWDLGKAVFSFWGGIVRFLLYLTYALLGFIKIILIGLWSIVKDIIFIPFRLVFYAGRNVVGSSVPWIAVFLTLFWCIIEASIFTYVMTPVVIDTFSNITGTQLAENAIRIPLFIFLFFIVLGSYAVLSTFLDEAKQKNISSIIGIGVIEIIVLFVEVVFLYREFVDSLVPWFAQYSENFDLGVFWTLAISCFVWFGIRSLSWFLFAAYGTPTLLKIIQGKGIAVQKPPQERQISFFDNTAHFFQQFKEDADWIQQKGDQLLNALIVPPLQIVASALNFIILLVTSKHLFEIPFSRLKDIKSSSDLIEQATTSQDKGESKKSSGYNENLQS